METEKTKNRPGNAPQVPCSLVRVKQSSKTQCVALLTSNNNLDVDLPQHREGRNLRVSANVYVLNMRGEPLMPCSPRKAKKLLKESKAVVRKRCPFTIQLTTQTGESCQSISLGVDSGTKFIGISATTEKNELFSAELVLDTNLKERLASRQMYRRNRRSRLWHREQRYNNRRKPRGWLPPSIERRYNTHINIIEFIKTVLPVSNVTIELGNFDTQKIKNQDINGKLYQQGDMYGYQNMRAYLIAREKGICQFCGKSVKGKKISLHHIESRKSGSNSASNMALLHEPCHKKMHKMGLEPKINRNKQFREHAFMNIMHEKIQKETDYKRTFGYVTFVDRNAIGLEKSHINDAFVVSSGGIQKRCIPFSIEQKRKNNRSLQKNRKGYAPSIRRQRYPIQINDLVKINGQWVQTKGTHCKGTRIMVNKKSINIKNVESVFHRGTLKWSIDSSCTYEADGIVTFKHHEGSKYDE